MLRSRPGILRAEVLPKRDGDAYVYNIESEVGVDIRKNLFYALAERNWPLVGMEALGMNLEDIFITVVDKSEEWKVGRTNLQNRITRRTRGKEKSALEREVAASLYDEAQRQRNTSSLTSSADNEDEDDDIMYNAGPNTELVVNTDEVLESGFIIDEDGPEDIMDVFGSAEDSADADAYEE